MPWSPPASELLTQSNTAAAVMGWTPPDEPIAPVPSDLSPVAKDYLIQVLHGLGRGVAAIPGIAGDIPTMAGRGVEWLGSKIAPETTAGVAGAVRPITSLLTPPTSSETVGFAQRNIIGERPTPKTAGARYAGNVAQYIPGSLIPLGGGATAANLAKQGLMGAVSGASAEGARELGLPPAVQIGAGILPGLLTSGANFISGRTGSGGLIRRATSELSPEDWQRAQQIQAQAREVGVPLLGSEALAPKVGPGAIGQLAADIKSLPSGAPIMNRVFEQRPAQITSAVKSAITKLGPTASADDVLSNVKSAAQNTLDAFERNLTLRTNKLYQAGDPVKIPYTAVNPIIKKVETAIEAAPSEGALTSELKSIHRRLLTPSGTPQIVSSALNTTKKELEHKIRPAFGLDAGGDLRSHAGVIGPIIKDIRDALHANNSYYAKADDLYAQLIDQMHSVIGTADNPSIIRRLAGAKNNAQLRSLLLDPENITPDTVRSVADMFRGQGRLDNLGAFMRHAMENEFNDAARQLQSGANPAMGVKFGNAVYGTEKQRALMQSYWDQLDPTGAAGRGLETVFKVTERTAKTPGTGSPTAQRLQLGQALGGGAASTSAQLAAGAAMAATGMPTGQLAGAYLVAGGVYNQIRRAYMDLGAAKIARALTAPDSVGRLRSLARKDPGTPAAATAVLGILGGRAQAEKE